MTDNDSVCEEFAEKVTDDIAREIIENKERIAKIEELAEIVAKEINSYSETMRSLLYQGFLRALSRKMALGVVDMIAGLEIVKLELFTIAERTSYITNKILYRRIMDLESLK